MKLFAYTSAVALELGLLVLMPACSSMWTTSRVTYVTRVYELGELVDVVDEEQRYFSLLVFKSVGAFHTADQLAQNMMRTVGTPETWRTASVETTNNPAGLIVTASPAVHSQVGSYLASLRRAMRRPRDGLSAD